MKVSHPFVKRISIGFSHFPNAAGKLKNAAIKKARFKRAFLFVKISKHGMI
jgi:hypothetical protein